MADDAEARYWAGRIAVAVGWPQEVHRFPSRAAVETGVRSHHPRAPEEPDGTVAAPRPGSPPTTD